MIRNRILFALALGVIASSIVFASKDSEESSEYSQTSVADFRDTSVVVTLDFRGDGRGGGSAGGLGGGSTSGGGGSDVRVAQY